MLDGVQWPSKGESHIIMRFARAYAHIIGILFFCCHKCHITTITHYLTTIYTNNRNNIQKISHFHAATPPQKLPETPSSTQLFDLHPKTTRHFPQNDTLFSIKPHVTFYKTTRHFLGDEEISTPSAVTLVTAKNKTP